MKGVVSKAGLYRLSDRLVIRLEDVRHVVNGMMLLEHKYISLSLYEMENLRNILECDACAEAQRIMDSIRKLTGVKDGQNPIEIIRAWHAERQAANAS
jgi:hypothetical protein